MRRIGAVFIGVLFGLIAAAVFSYCFLVVTNAIIGRGSLIATDIWVFYATSLPTAFVFVFVANYLYNKPFLTKKKLWILTFISVFCISLLVGGIGILASDLYMIGHIPDVYNYSGRIGWGFVYAFGSMPFSMFFAVVFIKSLSIVIGLIKGNSRKNDFA